MLIGCAANSLAVLQKCASHQAIMKGAADSAAGSMKPLKLWTTLLQFAFELTRSRFVTWKFISMSMHACTRLNYSLKV